MKRNTYHSDNDENKSIRMDQVKWFLFWVVVYGCLIWLFQAITTKYNLWQKPFAHYLFLGLSLRIFSKYIFSAVKKRTFSFRKIISWTIIYAIVLFLIDFVLSEFGNLSNPYYKLILTSIIFTAVIMFLRRANIETSGMGRPSFLRAPSQIFTGIALLVFGILCWRFSIMVFVNWLGWPEGMAWSWLIGSGLMIAGFLVLVAWWRNNVLQHRIGIRFGDW